MSTRLISRANAEGLFAKKTGEYPDLTAGTAEGLIGQSYEVEQSAYLYRKSHEGGRVREQIIGGTVAWNQLIKNGNFESVSNWRPYRSTYTVQSNEALVTVVDYANGSIYQDTGAPEGHKILVECDCKVGTAESVSVVLLSGIATNISSATYTHYSAVVAVEESSSRVQFRVNGNGLTGYCKNFQSFDLTAMFGSTIADYIYSLEQTTAGAGVAWLKQYIDLDTYHAYDAGSLKSVQTEGREVVGFNQWDEEWEAGGISNATGQNAGNAYTIRTKNYVQIIPSTTYYVKSPTNTRAYWYDVNQEYISTISIGNAHRFTTPADAHYMRFIVGNSNDPVTTYNHDICINLSDPAKNGTYKPYEKHTYPVSPVELRGIPKLVDNQLAFDGDVYAADGTVTRTYGIVDLGTLNWSLQGVVYRTAIPNSKAGVTNAICDKLNMAYPDRSALTSINDIAPYNNSTNYVCVMQSGYDSAAAVKAAMSGVYLVYKLATPTTEIADPYAHVQVVGETERWIDSRAVPVPVGQNSKYYPDYAEKIDRLPSDFSTLIAPTEVAYTATRNYASGDYLIVDNQLYMVTTAIANGGTITVGTNVRATTIMDEIKEIQNNI